MKLNKPLQFPWYIFATPFFYVLHAYNAYFGIIYISIALEYLCYYTLLSVVLFLLSLLILKNKKTAGVATTIMLILFFFWGSTHDWLKSLNPPPFLVSYKFLLLLSLSIIAYFFIILRKRGNPLKLNLFFSALSIILVAIEIGTSFFYIFSDQVQKNNPASSDPPLTLKLNTPIKTKVPDIFFMVFDEYTSSIALKKYYQFDNARLDSSLRNAGFFISSNSQSNYNATSFSLATTFNMQYFNKDFERTSNNTYSLFQGAYAFKTSLLPRLLKENNYHIVNYGLLNIEDHPANVQPLFTEYGKKVFSLETLWGRVQRDILWNITTRFSKNGKFWPADKNFINRNTANYSNFLKALNIETSTPKFIYGHVAIPHRPPYVDRRGHPRMLSNEDFTDKSHDSLYIEQVIYANTWIDSLINVAVTTKRNRPLVLIIEGDHGNRYAAWGRNIREKQFMNLNAYYFSDKDYSMLYDSISPVNSFRVVLNKYFNTQLPLLKDSTILLNDH